MKKTLIAMLLCLFGLAISAKADTVPSAFDLTATFTDGCDNGACFWIDSWDITDSSFPGGVFALYSSELPVGIVPTPAGYPADTTDWLQSESFDEFASAVCLPDESTLACDEPLFGFVMDDENEVIPDTLPFYAQAQENYQQVLASDSPINAPIATPEPAELALLAAGLLMLGVAARRRHGILTQVRAGS